MAGITALKIMANEETGELESATVVGQVGEAPDDSPESLQDGRRIDRSCYNHAVLIKIQDLNDFAVAHSPHM